MADTHGHGTTLAGGTVGAVGEITGIDGPELSVETIDTSDMASTDKWRTHIAGMKDAGEMTVQLKYDKTLHDTLEGAIGGAAENWTITFPDTSTLVISGIITGLGHAVPLDGLITAPLTIKFSGAPTFTAG